MRFRAGVALRKLLAVVIVGLAWLLLAGAAFAAEHGQADTNPEANLPYLFGLYTVTWLAFFAYAFYMTRRQRELRREIEELRRVQEDRK